MPPGAPPSPPSPFTVWLLPDQADLVVAVAERAGLCIAAVGCPIAGRAQELAARFEARPLDDLRAAISAAQPGLLFIAAGGALGRPGQPLDAAVLLSARERGVRIATLEPLPASLLDLTQSLPPGTVLEPIELGALPGGRSLQSVGGTAGAGGGGESRSGSTGGSGGGSGGGVSPLVHWAAFGPLTRAGKPFPDLFDALTNFGPVRSASIQCLGGPAEGSLGARLLDAMDLVLCLLGEPETIDAAYANPALTRNLHATPGETLHDLHGDLTANLRFPGGRSCALCVSNQASRWEFAATLIGPAGRILVTPEGFTWLDPVGVVVDESKSRRPRKHPHAPGAPECTPFAERLAAHLTEVRTGGAISRAPLDAPRALAMAQAGLLSARTGEGESPATMLRMVGV